MELLVTVPDSRAPFVKKLLKELNVAVRPAPKPKKATSRPYTPAQQEWIDDFRGALHEVELHQQGKIKLQDARDFLNEL